MMTRREFLGAAAVAAAEMRIAPATTAVGGAPMKATRLKCEYAENPLGIDVRKPRLSWVLKSNRRGSKQTAYQIIVSRREDKQSPGEGDLWDSGKVAADDLTQVIYEGLAMQSRIRCHWRVRVWDEQDLPSDWSAPAHWEMGLLEPEDWEAQWIGDGSREELRLNYTGPAPYFRKSFELSRAVSSARAYVCGLGFYELYLNGAKVGDHVLSPNQTDYDRRLLRRLLYPFDDKTSKRVLYVTYDVTQHLQAGRNVAGIILGHGWYNQRDRGAEGCMWYDSPRLILQIEIEYGDGSRESIVSDESWKVSTSGPLIHNGIFTGESYDARLDMPGWSGADYDDSAWRPAELVRAPTGPLRAQCSIPDKVVKTIQPISVSNPQPGVNRFDLGQNLAGWARLKVQGPKGRRITLRFIEEMGEDYGQSDNYVCAGKGVEVFEPRFTWHGFREVEMTGAPEPLSLNSLEGKVVHTAIDPAGHFECSNELFNRILQNCRWSQLSNMHCGLPSDCPHRERVAYTGDWGRVGAQAAIFNFDMSRFFTKWTDDIGDAQNRETGFVPHSAPFEGGGGGPPWGSAYVVVPWLMYLYYGDRRVLEAHYAGMRRWIEYLKTRTDQDGVVVREEPGSWCLGEWATPAKLEIPPPLVNTCDYAYVSQLMARIAGLLGRAEDVGYFQGCADSARRAVNSRFFDPARNQYHDGRQGANVFPLAFDLVPPQHAQAVFDRLVEIVVRDNQSHFDTGIMATPLLLDLLTERGRGDIAYALMNQTTFPSFGDHIAKGATTLWEYWNGQLSHNHAMFGSVCAWFYRSLAGINPDPEQPGFRNVYIRPYPLADLTYARAEYQSVRGRIASHWTRSQGEFRLNVDVPAGCAATVLLPAADPAKVSEAGVLLQKAPGIRFLGITQGRVACSIGSGDYEFLVSDFGMRE
jgi:alpha-L-rhamnosidase